MSIMTEHGREHTDGSRSGGQPVVATRKAHTAVLEVLAEWGIEPSSATAPQLTIATTEALCRAIEQHEAFRQEVSDAVGDTLFMVETHCDGEALALVSNRLLKFIIPKPKPDPLVEVVKEVTWYDYEITVKELRAALEARGLEIRSKNDD